MDRTAIPTGSSGWATITPENVYTRTLKDGETPRFEGTAAVSLVVQNYVRARAYLEEKAYLNQWEENDLLYQSPTLYTDDPTRARVSLFTVNDQTNTMADATRSGLFSQKPPFQLRQRGQTSEQTSAAWTNLLDTLLDRMSFRYWVGLGIDSQALHGTGIWKAGWGTRDRIVKKRKPKAQPERIAQPAGNTETVHTEESDAFEIVNDTVTESFPWIEQRMLGTTLFDPAWRTPNKPELCGYAIDIEYPTWNDLESLRSQDCYDIPDSEALKAWCFSRTNQDAMEGTETEQNLSSEGSAVNHAESRASATNVDPLSQPILMLEMWDQSKCIAILYINESWVEIRNGEHGMGRIPHFTSNWRSIENSGYGIGNGKLIGALQRVQQGTLNHALNLLAYQFNPAILHLAGTNAPTQNRIIRAGGFFAVNSPSGDVSKAMAPMKMPEVPAEAWKMLEYAQSSSEQTSGADSTFQQGNLGGRGSSAARTAAGVNRISSKSDGRVQTPVENLELGLFIPFLAMLMDWVKVYMPIKEVREILSAKMGEAIMKDFDGDAFMEADLEVEMLAASKLAAKAAMAQQLPLLMQIFQQPQLLEQLHNIGKTVDLEVLLDVLFQVSEFRMEEQIIVLMNDNEKQMYQATQNPQAGKTAADTQGKLALESVKGQNAQELEDRRAQNSLASDVTKMTLEHHLQGASGEGGDPAHRAQDRTGGGIPLSHAAGLAMRAGDEDVFEGKAPSPLAGV